MDLTVPDGKELVRLADAAIPLIRRGAIDGALALAIVVWTRDDQQPQPVTVGRPRQHRGHAW
jgi:hypothetical protein